MARTAAVPKQTANKASIIKPTHALLKRILASHRIDDCYYPVVLEVFRNYLPQYEVTDVAIELNTEEGAPHYAYRVTYIREDGQICREFKSYHKAFRGWNPKDEINKQLRKAVIPQTTAYKNQHYRLHGRCMCNPTHRFASKKEAEVDHYPIPFCDIVSDFMKEHSLTYETITNDPKGKNISPEILKDFASYHNANAKYRLVCRECNVKSFRNPDYLKKDTYMDSDGEEII